MNTEITFDFIIHLAFVMGVLMLIAGFFIMIAPDLVIRISRKMNTWVSTEKFFDNLDAPKSSERLFYRFHILSGLLLAVASLYIFYIFVFIFDGSNHVISVFSSYSANEWLMASFEFIFILFSVVIFIVGIVITFRPSMLKNIESWSNKWFMVDNFLKTLDVQLQAPDDAFSKKPRLLGFFVVLGSFYILMNLWAMM